MTSRSTESPAVLESTSHKADDDWRHHNVGRLLNNAVKRFEGRILQNMEAAGQKVFSLSHIAITRNLDLDGTRATELARRAGITKQSMSELVAQLEIQGLVQRRPDPLDRRAKIVFFTDSGLVWLEAFRKALEQAEREMEQKLGADVLASLKQALTHYGEID